MEHLTYGRYMENMHFMLVILLVKEVDNCCCCYCLYCVLDHGAVIVAELL